MNGAEKQGTTGVLVGVLVASLFIQSINTMSLILGGMSQSFGIADPARAQTVVSVANLCAMTGMLDAPADVLAP